MAEKTVRIVEKITNVDIVAEELDKEVIKVLERYVGVGDVFTVGYIIDRLLEGWQEEDESVVAVKASKQEIFDSLLRIYRKDPLVVVGDIAIVQITLDETTGNISFCLKLKQ